MNLLELERSELEDFTYYTVHLWRDKNKMGDTLPIAFKRKGNAIRRAKGYINSGFFEQVIVRKIEVLKRNADCEYSSSEPVEEFTTERRQ